LVYFTILLTVLGWKASICGKELSKNTGSIVVGSSV